MRDDLDGTTPGSTAPVRELRLEGALLWLAGGVLVAALVAAFLLGRWVERRATASQLGTRGSAALLPEGDELGETDVDEGASPLDRTDAGGGAVPEPSREVVPAAPPADPSSTETPPAAEPPPGEAQFQEGSAPAEDGPFFVQVFAGRDRDAAESLVGTLTRGGYRVRLLTEREGDGSLYKVRVGGYATREEAEAAADRLRGEGHAGAWITELAQPAP